MNKWTTDLELSKQLFEKKIIIDAEHWWAGIQVNGTGGAELYNPSLLNQYEISKRKRGRLCPAPIAEEILEKLPRKIRLDGIDVFLSAYPDLVEWGVVYDTEGICVALETDKKLSNASAKMALWLKANGYM